MASDPLDPPILDHRESPTGLLPAWTRWTRFYVAPAGIGFLLLAALIFSRTPTTARATPADPRALAAATATLGADIGLIQRYGQQLQQTARSAPAPVSPFPTAVGSTPAPAPVPAPVPVTGATPRPAAPRPRPRPPDDPGPSGDGQVIASTRTVLGRDQARPTTPAPASSDEALLRALLTPPAAPGPAVGPPPPAALASPTAAPTPARGAPAPAPGTHRVFEGTVLETVLRNQLSSSADGPVYVMVTNPVYAHDRTLVIPAGTVVAGLARRVTDFGQERMAVAFHRIILPNGSDVRLDQFIGANMAGDVGLKDQVDRHFLSMFGAAAAIGAVQGLSQWIATGFGRNRGPTVVVSGLGEGAQQATSAVMSRFLNQPPTVTIRPGHRVVVFITTDLDLPAYGAVS